MLVRPPVATPDPRPTALELELALASLAYVRDTVLISRGDADLLDVVILTAALDANMVPVDSVPDLARTYGGIDSSAPDELRRPVSMHAVAQSLGLSPETVRRRFLRLAAEGACEITPRGVIVPRRTVVSEDYKRIQWARYARAADYYRQWRALEEWTAPEMGPASAEPLLRAVNRVLSEYMLRVSRRLLAVTGDVLTSLVLLQLVVESAAGLDRDGVAAWARDPAAVGRRLRIVDLAAGLPFSAETVRRHLRTLEGLGFVRPGRPFLAPAAPPAAWPQIAALLQDNRADSRRLFNRLAALGVLAEWDAGQAPLTASAV
jgi:DNA-binding Lrp family transcriptional regulator